MYGGGGKTRGAALFFTRQPLCTADRSLSAFFASYRCACGDTLDGTMYFRFITVVLWLGT